MISDLLALLITVFILLVAIGFIATLSGLRIGPLLFVLAGFEGFFIATQAFNEITIGTAEAKLALAGSIFGLSAAMIMLGIEAILNWATT